MAVYLSDDDSDDEDEGEDEAANESDQDYTPVSTQKAPVAFVANPDATVRKPMTYTMGNNYWNDAPLFYKELHLKMVLMKLSYHCWKTIGAKGSIITHHSNPRALGKVDPMSVFMSFFEDQEVCRKLLERFSKAHAEKKSGKTIVDFLLHDFIHIYGVPERILKVGPTITITYYKVWISGLLIVMLCNQT